MASQVRMIRARSSSAAFICRASIASSSSTISTARPRRSSTVTALEDAGT
ncbi:hypothetical protein ACFQ3F_21345 [Nocardioides ginsengisoli]|uniref:Uncharacterized protein n=1 Tax=Nocardioides ginsengisoli TaxID=363868 RepID=A0ABW3W5P3_9ACTN